MELLATGFNAWHQLQFDKEDKSGEPDDIISFRLILKDNCIERPVSLLSCTFVETTTGIRQAGFIDNASEAIRDNLLSATAAIAGNGIVAEYDGHDIIRQYLSTSPGEYQAFSGMGQITQVVAYETGFAALSQDGRVWTWGDERYSACLGRTVTDSSPAERPGIVEELEDLPSGRIKRIGAAGYLILALTEGDDLYAWGGHPGRPAILEGLSSSPIPIVVDEDSDITDFGVGESHIIALTSNSDVYVIGDNTNGQLGLSIKEARSWTKIHLHLGVDRVTCSVGAGGRTSFILTKNQIL
ncbi:RCC1/BLIP-II [Hypoxylon trugodes]|uniref:RCC1/BLIP-II n=1 Tax=Hypoxylon trugodes TaxID=326681 RepID=UPI00219ABE0B|nr:RCC1/BLIP-II [Hypoxylon trugodes]KAI1388878.1 RCC1/BLIP-II [Hypoxylon trugodes]